MPPCDAGMIKMRNRKGTDQIIANVGRSGNVSLSGVGSISCFFPSAFLDRRVHYLKNDPSTLSGSSFSKGVSPECMTIRNDR